MDTKITLTNKKTGKKLVIKKKPAPPTMRPRGRRKVA